MATLSDLISRTRDRIGEPTEGYWTNAEIRSFINEAARDISRRSESLVTDDDAAQAVELDKADLVAEAEAWAIADVKR